jgi:hypothetical protein
MMEEKKYSSINVWKQAAAFYKENWKDLAGLLPVFFIPVVADAFTACLIAQQRSTGKLQPFKAFVAALVATPHLFMVKLRFVCIAALWSFLPVIGWYKIVRYRMYWAMASNVIVFEDIPDEFVSKRCKRLVELVSPERSLRTLITIPALLEFFMFLVFAVGAIVLQGPLYFWICVFILLGVICPMSGAVNTFLYLSLPEEKVLTTLAFYKRSLSYKKFCPRCSQFIVAQGMCGRFQDNVVLYPHQFVRDCNSEYFE